MKKVGKPVPVPAARRVPVRNFPRLSTFSRHKRWEEIVEQVMRPVGRLMILNRRCPAFHGRPLQPASKVDNVVLGVGGFLGLGEHYVAVPIEKLKWVNEPVRTSSTKLSPQTSVTVGANGRPARTASEKWYPDHAVYNATKDQLKAMPEFRYD